MQQRNACAPPTLTALRVRRRDHAPRCHQRMSCCVQDEAHTARSARKGRRATGRKILRPALPVSSSHASAAQKNMRRDGCGFQPGHHGAKVVRRECNGCLVVVPLYDEAYGTAPMNLHGLRPEDPGPRSRQRSLWIRRYYPIVPCQRFILPRLQACSHRSSGLSPLRSTGRARKD